MNLPEYLEKLNTFEIIEFIYLAREAAGSDLTNFMSVLFAFLAATFIVGDKVSRFQLWSVLFLYSVFMNFSIASLNYELTQLSIGVYALTGDEPDSTVTIFTGLLVFCWLLSIGFLVDKRLRSADKQQL